MRIFFSNLETQLNYCKLISNLIIRRCSIKHPIRCLTTDDCAVTSNQDILLKLFMLLIRYSQVSREIKNFLSKHEIET